jgi:hypothetical protein
MRFLPTSALLLAMTAPVAAQTPAPVDSFRPKSKPAFKLEKLEWMAGCWAGATGKDQRVEEHWTQPSDNLMLATTRYLTKSEATGWEFTRIAATDSGIVFAAASNGKEEHVYTMTRQASEYIAFERKTTEFPQRIMYRLSSDGSLIPRNEGDGQQSIELRLQRVRCPGDKK